MPPVRRRAVRQAGPRAVTVWRGTSSWPLRRARSARDRDERRDRKRRSDGRERKTEPHGLLLLMTGGFDRSCFTTAAGFRSVLFVGAKIRHPTAFAVNSIPNVSRRRVAASHPVAIDPRQPFPLPRRPRQRLLRGAWRAGRHASPPPPQCPCRSASAPVGHVETSIGALPAAGAIIVAPFRGAT